MKQLFLFLILSSFAFSQKDEDYSALQKDIEKEGLEGLVDFKKAYKFFFDKQRDSSFLYSSQAYNTKIKNTQVKNYLNLIYGINAYHKKAFALAIKKLKELPDSFKYKYIADYTLGNISVENKSYSAALNYYTPLLNKNSIKSTERLIKLYHNLGILYLQLKRYQEAEKIFLKEISLTKLTDTIGLIYSKSDLASTYYEQYKDTLAKSYFEEAYRLAKLFSNINAKASTTISLAVVEYEFKNYKKSAALYKEHLKWNDSLNNINNISKLLEKDKQLALAVKKKEIEAEKKITKKQQQYINLFIAIIIIAFLFLGILYYLFRIKTKQNNLINAQKKELEKLNNTKNYLFSIISHDLRSPTNILVKQQDKLLQQIAKEDLSKIKKHTNTAIKLTKSLQHLTNNILNWSLEQNNKVIFDKKTWGLSPIITQVLADFHNLAAVKQIDIDTNLNNNINIEVDRESLKIILRNLIDNAIKYSPEKGQIGIRTKQTLENKVYIEVKNSGEGISTAQLSKIRSLKEVAIDQIDRSKGVGLGLLLCSSLTKKNDAILEVESEQGKHTTIRIYFNNPN